MKKYVLSTLVVCSILISCKKEEKGPVPESTTHPTAYYPMTIGSYWIYENYTIDTNGVETKLSRVDSVYASGDTIIGGKSFTMLKCPTFLPLSEILRDSSGYLVNHTGNIVFAPNDFSDPLDTYDLISNGDTIFTSERRMEKINGQVTVRAGTFTPLRIRYAYKIRSNVALQQRELFHYRSPGVGLIITQSGAVADPKTTESRLARYHIEK